MKVGIIGGGVAGMIAAYRLSQQGHDIAGYGMVWGICFGLPLMLIGLPGSIVLFIAGVVADRRARREERTAKFRDMISADQQYTAAESGIDAESPGTL